MTNDYTNDYMLREIDEKILRYLLAHDGRKAPRLLRNLAPGVSTYRKQAKASLHRMQRAGLVSVGSMRDPAPHWYLTDLGRRLAERSAATLAEDLKKLGCAQTTPDAAMLLGIGGKP